MDTSTKQEELHNLIAQGLSHILNEAKENMMDILCSDEFACEPLEAKKLVDNAIYGKIIQDKVNELKDKIDAIHNNNGGLGQLRGWIKRRRSKLNLDETTEEEMALILSEVKAQTKHLMNGENILKQRICKYEQKDEQYYCLEAVDIGFKYCYDHWKIVKFEEE